MHLSGTPRRRARYANAAPQSSSEGVPTVVAVIAAISVIPSISVARHSLTYPAAGLPAGR